jgi:hypothetical protein
MAAHDDFLEVLDHLAERVDGRAQLGDLGPHARGGVLVPGLESLTENPNSFVRRAAKAASVSPSV